MPNEARSAEELLLDAVRFYLERVHWIPEDAEREAYERLAAQLEDKIERRSAI